MSAIYGLIEREVNLVHHQNGRPPRKNPVLQAFVGAYLLRERLLGIDTVTKATIVTGVSRSAIDDALAIIESDQTLLAAFVLGGRETLSRAAKNVRSQVKLISAFRKATPDDRAALGRVVGATTLFDSSISPSL